MILKSKKGTMMVEAALIFPLVIAAVAAVIYMVIGLYSSLSFQAGIHMGMRGEAGELSATVTRSRPVGEFESEKGLEGIRPVVRIEEEREYRIKSLFRQRISRTEGGRSYVIDEAELIRILSAGGAGT